MDDLINYPLSLVLLASLAAFLLASEMGRRIGSSLKEGANVSTIEAAAFGLLALMIGFTFSMALNRFDARRDALLAEANAIGTAALRARLLPAPHDQESLKLFKDYVKIRLDYAEHSQDPQAGPLALRRSNQIQEELWRHAQAVAAKNNAMVPTGIYIQALNETFDDQEKRLTIVRNRVPNVVFLGLYGVAIVAFWLTGYASGGDRRHWRLSAYVSAALVASVILLIEDLDRPTVGYITVSQQPMLDTATALEGYLAQYLNPPTAAR